MKQLFFALLLIFLALAFSFQKERTLRKNAERKLSMVETQKEMLESTIKEYLTAKKSDCTANVAECLNQMTLRLQKSGPECSDEVDGICPPQCAAGSDIDCCEKQGPPWHWIPGRGCYNR